MISKHPVCPERVRQIPEQFSWVDHRVVRDGHIDQCSHASAALYLFLITVPDARGLSYYSDRSLMKRLHMDDIELERSRYQLIHLDLIAYKKPMYQVMPLNKPVRAVEKPRPTLVNRSAPPQVLGDIFKELMGDAS